MPRWEPDTRGRLEQAALELYGERGFEPTTVAEIAARAGLTERTFFRHFADKREVLFGGTEFLQNLIVNAVADAPTEATPIEAVAAGLEAAGEGFGTRVTQSRRRQAIIDVNAELQARELNKLAALASAIESVLHRRGVPASTARLTAEAGIVVFRTAFERWIRATDDPDWLHLIRESLDALRAVLSGKEPHADTR